MDPFSNSGRRFRRENKYRKNLLAPMGSSIPMSAHMQKPGHSSLKRDVSKCQQNADLNVNAMYCYTYHLVR